MSDHGGKSNRSPLPYDLQSNPCVGRVIAGKSRGVKTGLAIRWFRPLLNELRYVTTGQQLTGEGKLEYPAGL